MSASVLNADDSSNALLQRLRTLRRDAGTAPSTDSTSIEPSATAVEPKPTTATVQLEHWLSRRHLQQRLQLAPSAINCAPTAALPGAAIDEGVHYIERQVALTDLPTSLRFESSRLPVCPRDLLAIDTETTGLSGGTGTRAFVIGIASIDANQLKVSQWLLTTLGGEQSMLQQFQHRLRPTATLLSYNGKSYDLPLLRTRFCLHRLSDASATLSHIDLLHTVRRRHRGSWSDCRLQTAERQLLSVVRDDDLPGSEAPAAFRRWLQARDATDLARVVEHNAQDLVSLMRLALKLGDVDPTQYRLSAARFGPPALTPAG